ncbi:DUF1573 domain-containing protein [Pedobacter sp. LMG 31464]|uniref:DUF1573 domain-containing protein n=1 Tax=Pedobacter planticolens TaxID=2679964 RepID=A0A923DWJ6_9SPHI|nr:DUF1573 domain-containing protein [Pedobacter planticolens]MBB2145294.1 DUF1573 domain-containing protein [Pedobacter planticolens]
MKKLILLAVLILGVGVIVNAQTKPAEFKFDTETHDFGKVTLNKPVVYTFNFTNIGDAPLIITKVETTCGCTVGEYTQTPVKKGEKGFVKVTLTPAGSPLPFNKAITLTSNARTTTKVLYVKGESIEGSTK